jgi:hypothetical protein
MRYNKSKTIKEVIENYVRYFKLSDKLNEVKINEIWEKLMGVSIAKHTTKIEIKKNKLYIFVDSSIIRSELSYAKNKIVMAINAEVGNKLIDEIVLL